MSKQSFNVFKSKSMLNPTAFSIVVYCVIWIVLAVVGQFCELWSIGYQIGIYILLLPILICIFSVLLMIGVRGVRRLIYLIVFPIFFGASHLGLQYATYGVRAMNVGQEFYANRIEPWIAFAAAILSLGFMFIGVIITACMNKFKDED